MTLRGLVIIVLQAIAVNGCGSSGGGASPPPPAAVVVYSGTVFASAPASNGIVTVYELHGTSKGLQLGATTLQGDGSYTLSFNQPSSPAILIEASSLCYDEMGYRRTSGSIRNTTCPITGVLSAAVSPASQNVHITLYTHAAFGLAQYRMAQGDAVPTAVNSGNAGLSVLVGTNVLTTRPVQPSVTATGTAGEVYGALNAGVASWFVNVAMIGAPAPIVLGLDPFTTLFFAETMRNDLAHDGLLNGVGGPPGTPSALVLGSQTMSTTIYRHQVAAFAATRIRGAGTTVVPYFTGALPYLPGLTAYNDRLNLLYDNTAVVPLDEGGPVIRILANNGDVVSGDYTLRTLVENIVGLPLDASKIHIDNAFYAQCTVGVCNHFINTTIFPNGPHTVELRSTNLLGQQNSAAVSLTFSN